MKPDQSESTGLGETKGQIFEIQRFSLHDGPGIRTTVFLKGCPLACRWCHNPEGISNQPILSFLADRCIGCGACFQVCRHGVHQRVEGKHVIVRSRCHRCGACVRECHAMALEMVGREVSVSEVIATVLRDESFYRMTGGGMTLSGGEPLAQMDFSEALLTIAKASDLHCCVETSGYADYSCLERLLPLVDLFLYDIKDLSNVLHERFTGVPNTLILQNLRSLHDRGAKIRLRLPIIPGFNVRDDHFRAVAALAESLPALDGVDLIPYHPLGLSKLDALGVDHRDGAEPSLPEEETIRSWERKLSGFGLKVAVP